MSKRINWLANLIIVAFVALLVASCGGGGGGGGGTGSGLNPPSGGSQQNPTTNGPPVISQLTPSYGNPGDTVVISGYNFGDFKGATAAVAFYNGVAATPTAWSDNAITVTVPSGAATGVVTVSVNNQTSQSVNTAYFTVGGPGLLGDPYVLSVSPPFGHPSDQIVIYGGNFGSYSPTGSIILFASASGTGTVPAAIVATGATSYAWTNSSIRCYVPSSAGTGPIVVVAGTKTSNSVNFTVLPPQNPAGAPTIDQLVPDHGPIGTAVKIIGSGFGNIQGTSIVHFNGILAPVSSWSPNEIDVTVPDDTTTGPVEVIVMGISSGNNILFTCELQPVITACVPDEIVIGKPVTIYGKNFGTTQGRISFAGVEPDYTKVTWGDSLITVGKAPIILLVSPVGNLTVTTSLGTTTPPFDFTLKNVLQGQLVESDAPPVYAGVATTSTFNFMMTAAGGTAPYSYQFRFGDGVSDPPTGTKATNTSSYIYLQQGTYTVTCLVSDADGITGIFTMPQQITIVPVGQPIITGVRDITPRHTDPLNFTPTARTTPTSALLLNKPLGYGGPTPATPPVQPDVIEIDGFNFGAAANASTKITFNASGIRGQSVNLPGTDPNVTWGDTVITFNMPYQTQIPPGPLANHNLMGLLQVTNDTNVTTISATPFWVGPRITQAFPASPSLTPPNNVISFFAYDINPYQVALPTPPNPMFGTDPGGSVTLFVQPPGGPWRSFPLSTLSLQDTGFQFDVLGVTSPTPGNYNFVIWVGHLKSGSPVKDQDFVNSGLMSDVFTVAVGP